MGKQRAERVASSAVSRMETDLHTAGGEEDVQGMTDKIGGLKNTSEMFYEHFDLPSHNVRLTHFRNVYHSRLA